MTSKKIQVSVEDIAAPQVCPKLLSLFQKILKGEVLGLGLICPEEQGEPCSNCCCSRLVRLEGVGKLFRLGLGLGWCLPWGYKKVGGSSVVLYDWQGWPIVCLVDFERLRVLSPVEFLLSNEHYGYFGPGEYPTDEKVFMASFALITGLGLLDEVLLRASLSCFGETDVSEWIFEWRRVSKYHGRS